MWLLLSMLIAAAPPRAQVSLGSRCDRALTDALKRSRALEQVTSGAELLIVLSDASTGFTLELQRPGRERLLQRQLAQNPECRDVAFASVVIIERFLRGIDLRAPPPPPPAAPSDAGTPPPPKRPPPPAPIVDAGTAAAPEPEPDAGLDDTPDAGPPPEPEPEPAPEPPPPAPPTLVDAGPPPPPPGPRVTRLELAASAGLDLSSTPHPLFALDAALFLRGLRLGLLGHVGTPDSSPVTIAGVQRGRIETQSFGALATVGLCRGPQRFCGLFHAGARFVRGSTSGDFLFQSTTVLVVRPVFALEAQAGWLPIRSLLLFVSLAGALSPAPAEFTVQGAPDSTRRLPIFEGQLRLGAALGVDR